MKEVIIDLKASPKVEDNAPSYPNLGLGRAGESRSSEQDYFRGFGEPTGGSGLGGTRSTYGPDATSMPYEDTYIGLHHNARGVRFAFQANNRKALLILIGLFALLSHPGFVDLLLSIIKPLLGGH